jgi:general secretion pathway protein H
MNRPRPARHSLAGFTLIELMVVIVIIGLLAAATLLSIGGSGKDSQLEQERDRLAALIDYVRERAALQTVEYGLRCEQGAYRFLMYDNRQGLWLEDPLDDALRARKLPSGLEVALVVEDRAIVLPRSPAVKPPIAATTQPDAAATRLSGTTSPPGTVPDLTPQVMLYSSGDLTPFKLTLSRTGTGRSTVLTGTSAGKFEVGAIIEKPT